MIVIEPPSSEYANGWHRVVEDGERAGYFRRVQGSTEVIAPRFPPETWERRCARLHEVAAMVPGE